MDAHAVWSSKSIGFLGKQIDEINDRIDALEQATKPEPQPADPNAVEKQAYDRVEKLEEELDTARGNLEEVDRIAALSAEIRLRSYKPAAGPGLRETVERILMLYSHRMAGGILYTPATEESAVRECRTALDALKAEQEGGNDVPNHQG